MNSTNGISPSELVRPACEAVRAVCFFLGQGQMEYFDQEMPEARERSKNFEEWLTKARDNALGIEPSVFEFLLDETRNMLERLRRASAIMPGQVDDLIGVWANCDGILRTSGFLTRYQNLAKTLDEIVDGSAD